MSKIFRNIINWFFDIFRVWRQEFYNVFHDKGVLIFFFLLPTAYPIVYSLIYNPELVRDVPVVVVDNSRSEVSRDFVRSFDATENVEIVGYASDMAEAREAMNSKECYGILFFPDDFSRKVGRGEQSPVILYCDVSLLMRYKGVFAALNNTSGVMGVKVQTEMLQQGGSALATGGNPVPSYGFSVGNTSEGFASFLLPGILILILHQSMFLGIAMLGAGERERRRKNNGYDPQTLSLGISKNLIGKALCYFILYIPNTIYILYFVPGFFSFPQFGNYTDIFLFTLPYLFACIFFGMTMQIFVREREDSFPVIVFTSVLFLFLSGLTWPRYAMSTIWQALGAIIPGTWGVEGFILMNGNGASLSQMSSQYMILWLMTAVYFMTAYWVQWSTHRRRCR